MYEKIFLRCYQIKREIFLTHECIMKIILVIVSLIFTIDHLQASSNGNPDDFFKTACFVKKYDQDQALGRLCIQTITQQSPLDVYVTWQHGSNPMSKGEYSCIARHNPTSLLNDEYYDTHFSGLGRSKAPTISFSFKKIKNSTGFFLELTSVWANFILKSDFKTLKKLQ